ncbi:hypothetical protein [Lactiplantibacillus daowaiensis]|uniref:Uncharacterized protein n=1 Tax=Lactiplantibacillus daowaiensis TaxID=2559918 RepID=A0ABW1RYH8_9LACO|nr:hypothetical protein [Lactiplantibacillus daowaiensis]
MPTATTLDELTALVAADTLIFETTGAANQAIITIKNSMVGETARMGSDLGSAGMIEIPMAIFDYFDRKFAKDPAQAALKHAIQMTYNFIEVTPTHSVLKHKYRD